MQPEFGPDPVDGCIVGGGGIWTDPAATTTVLSTAVALNTLGNGAPNLLYGPGSKAWSITVTPTYQRKIFFARSEFSFVGAIDTTPGFALGPDGRNTHQARVLLEAGILF